jgi:hypothetical protein
MRVRTVRVAGSLAVLCAVLVACGGGNSAGGAASVASTSPVATTSAVAPTSAAVATSAVPVAASFRADLTVQKAGLGLLALTNTGARQVVVRGWPTLVFLNAADEPVAVPMRKVDVPGAGPSITVGPGETAFAGLRWAVGDKADTSTFVATSMRLTPPGGGTAVNVNIIGVDGQTGGYTEFDLTSAQIGTLQPSSQGVLVF